jgi:hypothetical protein
MAAEVRVENWRGETSSSPYAAATDLADDAFGGFWRVASFAESVDGRAFSYRAPSAP